TSVKQGKQKKTMQNRHINERKRNFVFTNHLHTLRLIRNLFWPPDLHIAPPCFFQYDSSVFSDVISI
ncbi:hypothetical protein, partial [Neisseria sp. oral taxon 020]|uniref:hypothetical protein n=1 Tax=Neisseria sp. oral taxon 020 TaxID=712401 RepID=UPI001E2E1EA3